MAWWISAALSSKGLPVGQPMYQTMIRELVAQTYAVLDGLTAAHTVPATPVMLNV